MNYRFGNFWREIIWYKIPMTFSFISHAQSPPALKRMKQLDCPVRLHTLCKGSSKIWAGAAGGVVYCWHLKKPAAARKIVLPKVESGAGSENVVNHLLAADGYIFAAIKNVVYVYDEKILGGPFAIHAMKSKISIHTDQINDLLYENGILYTVGKDVTIRAWNVEVPFSPLPRIPRNLFLQANKAVAVVENPHKVSVTNFLSVGNETYVIIRSSSLLSASYLSSGSETILKLWDKNLKEIQSIDLAEHHSREVMTLCWSARHGRLWISSFDKHLSLWE